VVAQFQLLQPFRPGHGLACGHVVPTQLQAQHPAAGAHGAGQVLGGKARTGPEIQHPLAGPEARPLPGGTGDGLPQLMLKAQPL
jgi:hypothetical protein